MTLRTTDLTPVVPVTNCCCTGVRVTIHTYVPLSMEELRGENCSWLYEIVLVIVSSWTVTRPLIPENGTSFLVHVMFTLTSVSVTPPDSVAVHLRFTLLPAYVSAAGLISTCTIGLGTRKQN